MIVDERLSPVVALYVQIDVLYERTRDPCQPSLLLLLLLL